MIKITNAWLSKGCPDHYIIAIGDKMYLAPKGKTRHLKEWDLIPLADLDMDLRVEELRVEMPDYLMMMYGLWRYDDTKPAQIVRCKDCRLRGECSISPDDDFYCAAGKA